MDFRSRTHFTQEADSSEAGRSGALTLKKEFGESGPSAVLVYATVNHDPAALLQSLRDEIGPGPVIIGCSAQGVMSRGEVAEDGFLSGMMGFGGRDLTAATAIEREIQIESQAKGERMVQSLKQQLGRNPDVIVLLYDPLSGVDVPELLAGMRRETTCPIVGGGASQPWGPIVRTFQYFDREVTSGAAVALALSGPFGVEIGVCHGTSPTGIAMTVTRCDGNRLLEIDGRPALDMWREITGCAETDVLSQDHVVAWAVGVQGASSEDANGVAEEEYFIRAAFGLDPKTKAVITQATIPEGSRIMLHHRTAQAVLQGTSAMAKDLAARLEHVKPWAVLGFECGARTSSFLGPEETFEENMALQRTLHADVPWLGLIAWGEIAPHRGKATFHNYTFPIAILTDGVARVG